MLKIFIMKNLSDIIKASLILIAIGSAGINGDNASKYEGSQLFKIKKTPFVWRMLEEEELDVWSANRIYYDVLVPKNEIDIVKSLLDSQNIPYAVAEQNVAAAIHRSNPTNETSMRTLSSEWHDPYVRSVLHYQRYNEIYDYLDYLAYIYPDVASTGIMGYTGMGKPLKYIRIHSRNRNARAFLIDAGVHAREWVAPAAATYIIKQLVENRRDIPSKLLDLDFYILPVFNPDGYDYSFKYDRLWRKNRSKNGKCYGVDINRNFEPEFGGNGTSKYSCDETYHGQYPYSEMESRAFARFVTKLKNRLTGYVTFHSYGQYILLPYGFNVGYLPPDFNEMKEVGHQAAAAMYKVDGKIYRVGNTASMLYPAAGGSDDFVKAFTFAKYVYTIELRDDGKHGFVLPEELILPTAMEAFEAIKVIAHAASRV